MAASLAQLALSEVLREVHLGRYSRRDFARLPLPALLRLFDLCKGSSLVTDDTVDLFLQDGLPDLILSGVAGLVSSSAFRRALQLPPQGLREIGLYNCNGLSEDDITWLLASASQLETLNVGRLRALTDGHVQRLPQTCPALHTLVLNRNPQLQDALSTLAQLPALRELSLFGCTRLRRVAEWLSGCVGLTSLNVTKGVVEDWERLARGCSRLRVLVAPRQPAMTKALHLWSELDSLDATGVPLAVSLPNGLSRMSVCQRATDFNVDVLTAPCVRGLNFGSGACFADPVYFAQQLDSGASGLESFMAMHPASGSIKDLLARAVLRKPRLRELYLSGCLEVTAAPFESLEPGSLPRLRLAELAQMPLLTPLAVERLVQAAPGIEQLNLSGNRAVVVPDVAEEMARRCGATLRGLAMGGCGPGAWRDDFVQSLCHARRLCSLRSVNCSGSDLQAEGLVLLLQRVPTLTSIDASRTAVGSHDPTPAFGAVSRGSFFLLSTLALDGNGPWSGSLLEALLPLLPRLAVFSAQGSADAGPSLHLLPATLQSCRVARCELLGWHVLALARSTPHLTLLDVSQCSAIASEDMCESLALWPQLCSLYLSGCALLTDSSIALLNLTRLEVLHVDGTRISARAIENLLDMIPFLNTRHSGPKLRGR
jgi:Leucine-rich repeat (LRR) protein